MSKKSRQEEKEGVTLAMRHDQSRADKLDKTMLELLLHESAVESLGRWLADPERGQRYANGTGPHSIPYTPSKWMAVAPWPSTFADRTAADSALVSRAEVVAAVRAAEQSESWAEAFVATQVWGYGVTGYGPYRTRQVLAQPSAEAVLTKAVSLLVDEGAVAAYEVLNILDGLGPAFLTKFLYFAGQTLPEVKGPRPLILDSVLAGVLRRRRHESWTRGWLRVVRVDRQVDLARQRLEFPPLRRLPPVDVCRQRSTRGRVDRLARGPGRA